MFEEGSPNRQFLGPFNPSALSRPVLAPGKWAAWAGCEAGRREMGVDGQQFNIFLQMAMFNCSCQQEIVHGEKNTNI